MRVMIWFGLEEDQEDWTSREEVEGDFSVFAETVSLSHNYGSRYTLTKTRLFSKAVTVILHITRFS